MKKLISLLLIVSILLFVPVTGGALGTDATVDKAAKVLTGLGIMSNLSDGLFHPEYKITRGEIAQIMYSVLKDTATPEFNTNEKGEVLSSFSDVSEPSMILAVETAKASGFIAGFPDGSFKPDDELTFIQLIKIVVKMLGFDFLAEKDGGFPHGYITQAGKIDLLDGLLVSNYDQSINRGSAALILYRALRANMIEEGYYQGENIFYTDENTDSAFYRYMGISYGEGYMKETPNTSLTSTNTQSSGFYSIDSKRFKVTNSNDYTEFIGLKTEYYYYDERVGSGVNELLYLCSDDYSDKYHIQIKAEKLSSFSAVRREYIYTDDKGKSDSVRFSASANVLYNGVYAGNVLSEGDYTPDDGFVELYDTDKNGSFDLVRITDYTFITVGKIYVQDEEMYTFYDKFDGTKKVCIEDETQSIIRRTNGKEAPVYEIKENDILTLKISKDERLVTGVIGGKKKETAATVIETDGDRILLTVDGEVYQTTKNCYCESTNKKADSILGQMMVFYINAEGYIFAIEKAEAGYGFEYLIAADVNTLGSEFSMKTYSEEDKFIIDTIKNGIIVDGAKCKKPSDIYAAVTRNGVGKPIMVERDKNGNIVKIDTLYFNSGKETANESFNRFFPSNELSDATNLIYKSASSVFFYRKAETWEGTGDSKSPVGIDNDTKIMFVPSDSSDEDSYYIGSVSSFINDEEYPIKAYASRQTYGYAQYVIVQNDGDVSLIKNSSSQAMAVVCAVKSVYDREKDDEVIKLCYYQNGTYTEKICEKTSYKYGSGSETEVISIFDIKEGDVIRVAVNGKDVVESIYPYCINKTAMPSDDSGYITNRMLNVFSKYDKNIVAVSENTALNPGGTTSYDSIRADSELFRCDKFRIYLYDSTKKEKERVSVSSIDDIYDYTNYGKAEMSKIFVNTRLNNPGIMVIYK